MTDRAGGLPDPARFTRTLCVLFFFSGFPALIYQLVWQRALFRIFGVNVESVTVVVTAFMVGLGLGSLLGGWLSGKDRVPLLPLLAAIELLTAAFGLASLRLFDGLADSVVGASLPVAATAALALVIVPTLLMGATLPVLVEHLVRRTANVGSSVGLLYCVNTLGAGAACLAAAGLLFPFLGMQRSVHAAVAMNVAVALGALGAQVRGGTAAPLGGAPRTAATEAAGSFRPRLAAVLALSFLGGLVSLSYEIFLFRLVSYATGSSAPAFAVTLAAFLAGIAWGSLAAGRSCRKAPEVAVEEAVRALVAANVLGWAFLPVLGQVARAGWVVLPVALAFVVLLARSWGVLLPTLAHLGASADHGAGMRTARIYFANIVGSATGSIATGFVLMDRLTLVGIQGVLIVGGVTCAIVLDASLGRARGAVARAAAAVAFSAIAIGSLPPLASRVLERTMWKRPAAVEEAPFAEVIHNRSGIVAVDTTGTIFGHGMYDGRFNTDPVNDTNGIVRAYALSLFHPAPRDVLMIGLSSGSWAQVIANNPEVRSLTIVEINPAYLALVRRTALVASLLSNPKVAVHVDDGRRWLRAHRDRRFDAVVSNTTFHFRAHASSLLSVEFLELIRSHLEPGGILLYNTTGSARVQRTGCAVYDHGARFSNQLVVSASELDVDFARWRRTLEAYRIDGRPVLDPARPEERVALDRLEPCSEILARTGGMPLVTDDNMGTEWRFIYGFE